MAEAEWGSSSAVVLVLLCWLVVCNGSPGSGDDDPLYRSCLTQCEGSGCVEEKCFKPCTVLVNHTASDGRLFMQEPFYLRWNEWNCKNECCYQCMLKREIERENLGQKPVKYHGKWPFKRIFGIQEPVSGALSALNLAMLFHGWVSFVILVYYKLPLKPEDKSTYYEFTGLWNIYAVLCMNSWFWSVVFHSRNVELTEKLDYSSAVALVGCTLLVTILRTFNVTDEATRVIVAAPLIAFVTTHILYLNFYEFDYRLDMCVCVGMEVLQLFMWTVWAHVTCHKARSKLWALVLGGTVAILLNIFDFAPLGGYVDAHALWHATKVPVTCLKWSCIKDDALFRTSKLIHISMDKKVQ